MPSTSGYNMPSNNGYNVVINNALTNVNLTKGRVSFNRYLTCRNKALN